MTIDEQKAIQQRRLQELAELGVVAKPGVGTASDITLSGTMAQRLIQMLRKKQVKPPTGNGND